VNDDRDGVKAGVTLRRRVDPRQLAELEHLDAGLFQELARDRRAQHLAHSSVPPGSAHSPVSVRRMSSQRPSAVRAAAAMPTTGGGAGDAPPP